jgi:hypothetical protein
LFFSGFDGWGALHVHGRHHAEICAADLRDYVDDVRRALFAVRQKKGQPQHTIRRFVQVVVFKRLKLMSMATASMTGEHPSQSNLRRKTSPYENPLARLSLLPLHPNQSLEHSPWPQAQSAQAPWPHSTCAHSTCAQAPPWQLACGQGWGNSCVAQGCPGWTQGVPVVDMLVLPTITPAASADNGRVAAPATVGFRFRHMSSARSTSDGRGPVTRQEFRIGRSQGNLARTPDVAVVIHLKLVFGPCG